MNRVCKNCGYAALTGMEDVCPSCKQKIIYNCKVCGKELFNGRFDICPSCKRDKYCRMKKIFFIIAGSVAAAALFYVVCPLDFDWVGPAGWIDDLVVAIIATVIALGGVVTAIVFDIKAKKISAENNA